MSISRRRRDAHLSHIARSMYGATPVHSVSAPRLSTLDLAQMVPQDPIGVQVGRVVDGSSLYLGQMRVSPDVAAYLLTLLVRR